MLRLSDIILALQFSYPEVARTTPFQSRLSAGSGYCNHPQLFPDHYLGSNIEGILARRSHLIVGDEAKVRVRKLIKGSNDFEVGNNNVGVYRHCP